MAHLALGKETLEVGTIVRGYRRRLKAQKVWEWLAMGGEEKRTEYQRIPECVAWVFGNDWGYFVHQSGICRSSAFQTAFCSIEIFSFPPVMLGT